MGTKSRFRNGMLEYYDPAQSHERTAVVGAPVTFYDDFLGTSISTGVGFWTPINVSTSTNGVPVLRANIANGIARIQLHSTGSTANNQESGLTWGDQLPFDLDQGLVFETRVAQATLVSGAASIVWGLGSALSTIPDSMTVNAWFRADSSQITVETDDNVTNNDDIATGQNMAAGTFRVFRIDATNTADVLFYIDGAEVASTTTFSVAASTVGVQPFFYAVKSTASTGVGILDIDYVRVWQKRAS